MPPTATDLPARPPSLARLLLKLTAGLFLAGGFLYWFLRGTNLKELGVDFGQSDKLK